MTDAVTPYQIAVSDDQLADLRSRLQRTRWPERENADDWSQGIPLAYTQEICEYWANEYDWRRAEAQFNAFPQVWTVVDGLGFHVIHARSPEPDAMPLVMTHGWPGSLVEFLEVLGPLSDPVRHGGQASDAFHVVCPSLPGYGFSDKPAERGWGPERTADAWATIMTRLGYDRFGAEGGDWGALVSTDLAMRHTERVIGLHLSSPTHFPAPDDLAETDAERKALERVQFYQNWESGYAIQQSSRPQTLGYGLVDSPAMQAAWLIEKFWAWTDHNGDIAEIFTRDQLLDNVMMYWLPGAGASAGRLYWEGFRGAVEKSMDRVEVPMGMSVHPADITRLSRRWVEREYLDIRSWTEVARGGHFGAFEQPEQFVDEVRNFYRLVR